MDKSMTQAEHMPELFVTAISRKGQYPVERITVYRIGGNNGFFVADLNNKDIALRIVACVNALRGLNPEKIGAAIEERISKNEN